MRETLTSVGFGGGVDSDESGGDQVREVRWLQRRSGCRYGKYQAEAPSLGRRRRGEEARKPLQGFAGTKFESRRGTKTAADSAGVPQSQFQRCTNGRCLEAGEALKE